jgi:hypothetical protein
MRKFRVHGLRFVAFGLLAAGIFGLVTSGLWNLLMPHLFGLPVISFWQALGLLALSRILFGSHGGWGRRMRKGRFVRGLGDLSPEERERFRQAMQDRCGRSPAPERM